MGVWYMGVRVMIVSLPVGSMQMCKDEHQRARMQHSIESALGDLLLGDSLLAQCRGELPEASLQKNGQQGCVQMLWSTTGMPL